MEKQIMTEKPYRSIYHCIEKCFHTDCVAAGACHLGVSVVIETNVLFNRTVRKKEKKARTAAKAERRIELCQQNKKFCSNADMCTALGYCMLQHPAMDEMAKTQIRGPQQVKTLLKIFKRVIATGNGKEDATLFVEMMRRKLQVPPQTETVKGNCRGNFRSKNCTNHKVCHLLGQCMKEHPLIKNRGDLVNRLSGQHISTKNCVAVFEETMPSLKRIGKREFFKPESEFK